MKTCAKCKQQKQLSDFVRNRSNKDGYGNYCKPCHNLIQRTFKASIGGSRYYHLKRRYGIGKAEFDALLEKQNNQCAICAKPEPTHLDHEHVGKEEVGKFGRVRGILCVPCNNGLGLYRDNPELLRTAADYLER